MYTSSSFGFNMNIKHFIVATRFLWVRITPLGVPVDPEVYITMAVSSGVGAQSSMCGLD